MIWEHGRGKEWEESKELRVWQELKRDDGVALMKSVVRSAISGRLRTDPIGLDALYRVEQEVLRMILEFYLEQQGERHTINWKGQTLRLTLLYSDHG